jgi:hypothetical protein
MDAWALPSEKDFAVDKRRNQFIEVLSAALLGGALIAGCDALPTAQPGVSSTPTARVLQPTLPAWASVIAPLIGPTPDLSGTSQPYTDDSSPCDLPEVDFDSQFCGIDFSASFPDELNELNDPHGLHSPDGEWMASPCDNIAGYSLDVYQMHGDKKLEVMYGQDAVSKYGCTGYFFPKRWSADGKTLYYAANRSDVEPRTLFARDGHALLRLDLATGESTEILGSTVSGGYYAFAFSPDEQTLAYIAQPANPLTLTLQASAPAKPASIPLDAQFCAAGRIVWSPDGKQLIYLGWKCGDSFGADGRFTLVLFDVANQTQQWVFSDSTKVYYPFRWDLKGPIVKYSGAVGDGSKPGYFRLDLATGQLTAVPTGQLDPPLLVDN